MDCHRSGSSAPCCGDRRFCLWSDQPQRYAVAADSGADSGKHGGFIGRNHSDRKDRKDETVSSDIQSDCGSMFRNRLVISTNWYSDYAWRNRFLFRSNDANFYVLSGTSSGNWTSIRRNSNRNYCHTGINWCSSDPNLYHYTTCRNRF